MQQLTFESLLLEKQPDLLTEVADTRTPFLHQISDKPDHELLEILGFEVGKHRGSIHDLLKELSYDNHRVKAFQELAQRYNQTPFPKGKVFRCADDLFQHYQYLRELKQEHFIVVLLNNKHELVSEFTVTIGLLNRSLVHPREVFAPAIEHRAAAIVCLHNHPTSDCEPSQMDIETTQRLQEVGKMCGIPVLDHLIIGDGEYVSMANQGLI